MVAYPRHTPVSSPQHVISRFIDRNWCHADTRDRQAYLSIVERVASTTDWMFFAYALMSSHEHWAIIPGLFPFGRFFHLVHSSYSAHYRRRNDTIGPIYSGRPKNIAVCPSRLLNVIAYIHMNPVRAGVVHAPADSKWTTHRYYTRQDTSPSWIDIERNLSFLGFDDTECGRSQFDDAIRTIETTSDELSSLPKAESSQIAYVLGSEKKEVSSLLTVRQRIELIDHYLEQYAAAEGIEAPDLSSKLYLKVRLIIGRELNCSCRDLARYFSISKSSVARLSSSQTTSKQIHHCCHFLHERLGLRPKISRSGTPEKLSD